MSTGHHDTPATRSKCLPTYLVLDTSGSMELHADVLNETLGQLYDTLVTSPKVSEFAYLSIVTFNERAFVVLPMTDIDQVPGLPVVSCAGGTHYGEAFRAIRERIDVDIPALRAAGKEVLRPVVFLLTDGEPMDPDWHESFLDLVDRQWQRYPNVITYGFGAANADVLSKVATKAAFLAERGNTDRRALTEAITSLVNSLVASAHTEQMQVPQHVPGFTNIPFEYVG
ncbi:VWA domain-containing protein [Dactylosporangium sp. NPDC051541]|uniref:vWA domain-containing protein n=1 Tax=Dactylosporangium sp. NPDC051541 TaxID=3363977 RepID=UPI003790685B